MSNIKTLQKIRPVKKQIKMENKQKQEENKTAQSNE